MKKLFAMVLVLCMVASCACAASFDDLMGMLNKGAAEDNGVTWDMPELALSLKVPEEYVVLCESAPESAFTAVGADKASTVEYMLSMDTYMLIFPGVFDHEIDVVMTPNDITNFDTLSDDMLNQISDVMSGLFAEQGCTIEKNELRTVNGVRYICTWYKAPSGDAFNYVMQYYTIENNKAMVYRLFSYSGSPIAQEMQDKLYDLVAGVSYN